jgi:DNA-binding transcriptional LysR family regulator
VDLRQIRQFIAVAEAGSVSRAAAELRIAQPSLSVTIRHLEAEFGTELLVRSSRGVHPTPVGRYLAEAGRRLLQDVDNASEQIRSLAAGRAGRLSLAVTPAYCWVALPALLRRLAAAAPEVQILLRDPPPLEIVDLLTVGTADLGIVATHDLDELRYRYGDRFEMVPIGVLPAVMALPPTWADHDGAVRLEELRDEAWVVPLQSRGFPGMAALTELIWRREGWSPPVVREVSTSQTGLPIVSGGLGVALVPETVWRIAGHSVILRPLLDDVPGLTTVLLSPRDRPASPAARLFTDLVRDDPAPSNGERW